LFFTGQGFFTGEELYWYNGVDPPSIVVDLQPGPGGSSPLDLTPTPDYLFMSASSGIIGQELFALRAGGTSRDPPAAPELVYDLVVGGSSNPRWLAYFDSKYLVFAASSTNSENPTLWILNITGNWSEGPTEIAGTVDGTFAPMFLIDGQSGVLYFSANDYDHGRELWGW